MEPQIAFKENQISVRLSDSRLTELNKLYNEAIGEPGRTIKESFENVIDLALNGVKKIDNPETLKRLKELEGQLTDANNTITELRSQLAKCEESESSTITSLREEVDTLKNSLEAAIKQSNDNAMIAQSLSLANESADTDTIKLTDPELVKELKIIQLAIKVQLKHEDDYNTIIKRMIGACRKVNTFIISSSMRKQLTALIK